MPQSFLSAWSILFFFNRGGRDHTQETMRLASCIFYLDHEVEGHELKEEVKEAEHAEHRPIDQPVRIVWRIDGADCLKFC